MTLCGKWASPGERAGQQRPTPCAAACRGPPPGGQPAGR